MLLFRTGDKLFEWDSSHSGAREIFATSETEYFWKDSGASLAFFKDSNGKVQSYDYRSDFCTTSGERISATIDASVDPASYESLVGASQLAPKLLMTITKRGSHLCVNVPPSPEVEIFPTSPLSFFVLGANASIRFQQGDNTGIANVAFLRMGNGRENRSERIDVIH
jgi:hypothetical protein